jgi:outer membrane lipoprotein LolB
LRWQEDNRRYTLNLLAPLGAGGMTLTGTDHHLTLTTDDGKVQQAGDPSELLRQNGGPPLPVQNLRYWVRGLPAPFSTATKQFDAYGRLSQILQDGWQIDYLSYTHALGQDLPSRLNAQSADTRFKLVIYEWQ